VIPGGTGNDFVQLTGFPDAFTDDDWKMFFSGNIIDSDAGEVNGMIFLNGMGLGFDAQVAYENYAGTGEVKKGEKCNCRNTVLGFAAGLQMYCRSS
jgi:diacylglycerol kinase family enzyme